MNHNIDLSLIDRATLSAGAHPPDGRAFCAMELAAFVAGEKHTDHPACASPVITSFMIAWNDALQSNAERDRLLKPLLRHVIGTRSTPADETRRSYMALDWLIRHHVPAWFDLTPSLKPSGDALRTADEIVGAKSLAAIQGRLAAAGAAAGAAAWDAAGAVAWAAAGAAAWAAARAAALDAAGDAAWAAAGAAAWAAARAAAGAALTPTVIALQASAQDLVRRMCAVSKPILMDGEQAVVVGERIMTRHDATIVVPEQVEGGVPCL